MAEKHNNPGGVQEAEYRAAVQVMLERQINRRKFRDGGQPMRLPLDPVSANKHAVILFAYAMGEGIVAGCSAEELAKRINESGKGGQRIASFVRGVFNDEKMSNEAIARALRERGANRSVESLAGYLRGERDVPADALPSIIYAIAYEMHARTEAPVDWIDLDYYYQIVAYGFAELGGNTWTKTHDDQLAEVLWLISDTSESNYTVLIELLRHLNFVLRDQTGPRGPVPRSEMLARAREMLDRLEARERFYDRAEGKGDDWEKAPTRTDELRQRHRAG